MHAQQTLIRKLTARLNCTPQKYFLFNSGSEHYKTLHFYSEFSLCSTLFAMKKVAF